MAQQLSLSMVLILAHPSLIQFLLPLRDAPFRRCFTIVEPVLVGSAHFVLRELSVLQELLSS